MHLFVAVVTFMPGITKFVSFQNQLVSAVWAKARRGKYSPMRIGFRLRPLLPPFWLKSR
jgi:hypothetical protein